MSACNTSNPSNTWAGRSVFVTGHTGFKGGWLSLWLARRGAMVHGYALDPPAAPGLYSACGLADRICSDTRADIRNGADLRSALHQARPDVVFHLAAQPLVRRSYEDPLATFDVNVMGTAALLDAVLEVDCVRAVVVVTTDKCYENREWDWPYRENDPLGGFDPYSASKACTEHVVASFRRSFYARRDIGLATARAGNVIGGGDCSADRLVPDCLRAIDAGKPLAIRAPNSIRPWQHVLEPLSGYMTIANRLLEREDVAESWNFGPEEADVRSVGWIVDRLCRRFPSARWYHDQDHHPHEAGRLALDSSKARMRLGWRPRWNIDQALNRTVEWHIAWRNGADMKAVTEHQIDAYEAAGAANEHGVRVSDGSSRVAA